MAINKNFVIKNGVEVNTSLIVGDATLNKVGVGTTVPGYTLHVGGSRGGIGATDITITGIATVGTSGSTSAALSVVGVSSFQGDVNFLGSAGVSTITFDASLDKLNFADNARATFGASDDLQIFHDGSNSIIRETGTGNIVLEGSGETLAVFADDGAVSLYYDNANVFQTTPQGVNVSGVTTSNRLNISGVSTFTSIGSNLIPDGDGSRNIGAAGSEWQDLHIDGTANIDTLAADTAAIGDLTENRVVIAGTSGELEDDSNFTFDGAMLKVGTAATVAVNGNAAFAGIVTVGGDLKVTGDLEISEDLVLDTNLNLLGIASISNLDNTGAGIGSLSVTGVSTFSGDLIVGVSTLFADVSAGRIGIGTAVPASTLDVDGALTVNSAKVEDLTDNRIVIAGSSGELEDDSNLTFDGVKLNVGSGVTIFPHGGAAFAGIVTVGGDLNVQGDIVYDEITGRNLNITGISTQAGQVNFGTSGVGATVFANGNVAISGVTTSNGGVVVGTAATIFANGNAAFVGVVTAGTALVAASAKVEDLTDNRVVLAGTGGELEDSANLTFDGAGLVVTGNANISGVSTLSNDLIVGVSTLFVDVSAGLVGIGTDDPSWGVSTGLIVGDGASAKGITIFSNSANVGDLAFADATSGTARYRGLIRYDHSDNSLALRTNSSERARIDSSGRLGIGTDNPGAQSSSADNLVVADFAGEGGITIKNGSNSSGNIFFADEAASAQGRIQYNHVSDYLRFFTGGDNERLRIDSSGRVGIGTNNPAEELHLNFSEPTIRLEDSDNNRYAQINAANGNLRFDADQGNEQANTEIAFRIDGSNVLTITDAADIGVVLGGGATVGSSSGIVTFIGDGSQLTGVISGIDITEDAGLVGAAITNIKFTGSGISTVTTDTTVGIATINITGGGGGGVSETDTSVSTTTATGVGSFAVATHRSAAIIAQIDQGGSYQVGRYLMIHDGTTATVIEESAIATGDMLGSFTADVNNSNAELKVTMNSSGIATVTTKIDTVTV